MTKSEKAHYEHQGDCEECTDDSERIHESAEEIRGAAEDASGLLKMALDDVRFQDDRAGRDLLISAAQHLARAIRAEARLIEDETYEQESSGLRAVEGGESRS